MACHPECNEGSALARLGRSERLDTGTKTGKTTGTNWTAVAAGDQAALLAKGVKKDGLRRFDVCQKKAKSALIRPIRQVRVFTSRCGRLGATDVLNDSDVGGHCGTTFARGQPHGDSNAEPADLADSRGQHCSRKESPRGFYSEALLLKSSQSAQFCPLKPTKTQKKIT
jgi:hypothetical protein